MRRKALVFAEESDEGRRLDIYLAGRFTYHSRTEWQNLVEDGKIQVNGKPVRASRKLRKGDRIEYDTADITEPEVDASFQIVFSDDYIIAVDKSGNLPCHPAGIFFRNTLWWLLTEKYGKVYFVNRIDRETSGMVLVARSPEIAAKMSDARYGISKKYIAFVHGDFQGECHAKGYLCPDPGSKVRKKRRFCSGKPEGVEDAEFAETMFSLASSCGGISAIDTELVTGRLHQIRATLCSLGFPLVGDKIYGLDESIYIRFVENRMTDDDRKLLMIGRQALHSAQIGFRHPVSGENLVLKAELPEDMRNLLLARR